MPLLLVAPLIFILAAFVAYGAAMQSKGWANALGGWLRSLAFGATFLDAVTGGAVTRLASWIAHHIGQWFYEAETVAVQWIGGLRQYVAAMAEATLAWPWELFKLTQWLLITAIPALVKALPNSTTTVVHDGTKVIKRVEKIIYKIPKLTRAQIRAAVVAVLPAILAPELVALYWLVRHFRAVKTAVAHPGGIAIPGIKAPGWVKDIAGLRKRVRTLEQATAAGVGAALLVRALAKLKLGWIRCTNVRKAGRRICGLDTDLLEALLAGTIAVAGTISIVEFAEELQKIMPPVTNGVRAVVREAVKADTAIKKATG